MTPSIIAKSHYHIFRYLIIGFPNNHRISNPHVGLLSPAGWMIHMLHIRHPTAVPAAAQTSSNQLDCTATPPRKVPKKSWGDSIGEKQTYFVFTHWLQVRPKTHPSIAAPKKDRQVICYFRFLRSLGCSPYCSWQQPPYVLNSMTPQKNRIGYNPTFYIGGCHFGWWLRICFTNMIDIYWPSYHWLVIHSNPSFTWLTFEWRV